MMEVGPVTPEGPYMQVTEVRQHLDPPQEQLTGHRALKGRERERERTPAGGEQMRNLGLFLKARGSEAHLTHASFLENRKALCFLLL